MSYDESITHHAIVREGDARVPEEPDGPEHVGHHHGLEDVELEVAVGAADGDGHVVAHDLRRHHRDGLALRRVHLARHDGAARLVLGQGELAEAAPGSWVNSADFSTLNREELTNLLHKIYPNDKTEKALGIVIV